MADIYRLYDVGTNGGRRIVELVSRRRGEALVNSGKADAGLDVDGKTVCYRLTTDGSARAQTCGAWMDDEASSNPSLAALTRAQVDAIAGTKFKFGKSKTAGLSEEKKLNRVHPKTHRVLPPEDLVELATAKLQAWGKIGPALAELAQ